MSVPPPSPPPPSQPGFWRSLGYACQGLREGFRTQLNFRIHCTLTVGVIAAGLFFQITPGEWCLLALSIGLVCSVELLNTAIEILCDRVTSEMDDSIRRVKDVAAGGVLCAALAALAIGLFIFLPRLTALIF